MTDKDKMPWERVIEPASKTMVVGLRSMQFPDPGGVDFVYFKVPESQARELSQAKEAAEWGLSFIGHFLDEVLPFNSFRFDCSTICDNAIKTKLKMEKLLNHGDALRYDKLVRENARLRNCLQVADEALKNSQTSNT